MSNMRAFVRYDKKGIIVPSSFVMKKNKPKVGRWLEISTTKSVSGTPTQSSQGNLRAFVRYNSQNKIVPGSIVVRGQVPENGNWVEITYDVRRPVGNERPFILEYTITSPNTEIYIQLGGPNFSGYDFSVDWGDGNVTEDLKGVGSDLNSQMFHTYTEPGVYDVQILGKFPYLYLWTDLNPNRNLLTDIKQWGTTKWESFAESFRGCTGLTNITATDAPDLTRLRLSLGLSNKQMYGTFQECTNLTNINFMSNWNFKGVESFVNTLRSCTSLTDYSGMENWNMSTVKIFDIFYALTGTMTDEQAQYMSKWDMSSAERISYLTYQQPLTNLDFLSNWNANKVKDLSQAFGWSSSLTDTSGLSNWNPYQLEKVRSLLNSVTSLNNSMLEFLDEWDLSTVTDIGYMFYNSSGLAGTVDLSNWNLSSLQNAEYMFFFSSPNSSISNINVTNWGVTNLTAVRKMFYNMNNADITGLGTWNPTSLTNAFEMFENSKGFTGDGLGQWVNTPFQNINDMLFDNDSFDESLANWDISNLTNANTFMNAASGMSTANYDATLIGWAAQIPLSYNGALNFGGSKYSLGGSAEAARDALIADGVSIVDGGGIDTSFIFTVKTDNSGTSASNQFRIPTIGTGYNYDIEYDGQTLTGQTGNVTLTFPSGAGTYDVKIIGSFPQFYFNNGGDRRKLLDIKKFGNYALGSTNQNGAFYGCSNLIISATDIGHFENVISLYQIWRDCSSLISFPLIDTSSVTEFTGAWQYCSSLTSFPLIDTSSGTDFRRTWQGCSSLTSFPLLDTSSGVSFGGNLLGAWQNCTSLTTFPANAFDTNIASNYANAFSSTNLSTQSIDDILVSLDTNGVSNGIFKQSLGQAPSATGLAARDNLVAKGWTITITT